MSYNDMPEPLLQFNSKALKPSTLVDDSFIPEEDLDTYVNNSSFEDMLSDNNFYAINNDTKAYSTYDYLLNSIGEPERAELLKQFITLLMKLTWDFPYYIKSIEGINELLEVDPKRGSRVKKDATLTIKCYEGLDQRISTLKNLYKKVAWDDTYQRWILPDMMRFFRMDIYISEFRIFHEHEGKKSETTIIGNGFNVKKESKLDVIKTIKNTLNNIGKLFGTDKSVGENAWVLTHSAINNVIPTTKIECHMCEFDISNIFSHFNTIGANNPKEKVLDDLEIKIKVGNIKEIFYNESLNYINRNEKDKKNFPIGVYIDDNILANKKTRNYKTPLTILEERTGIQDFSKDDTQMFNNSTESRTMSYLGKAIKDTLKGALDYADNLAERELNKLMMKNMGNSGINFNDALTAITSANINTMYNTFKTKAQAVKERYPEVSQATKQDMEIETFKSFIKEVSYSKDETQSKIAKILLDYGTSNNLQSIDEYLDILLEVNKEIQNEVDKKIINYNTNKEKELSQATKDDNKIDTKIVL